MRDHLQDVEQSVPEPAAAGARDPAAVLLLRAGGHPRPPLPGRHPRDAEVQQRGGLHVGHQAHHEQPPRHADADADEALQSPEELLHCRV